MVQETPCRNSSTLLTGLGLKLNWTMMGVVVVTGVGAAGPASPREWQTVVLYHALTVLKNVAFNPVL